MNAIEYQTLRQKLEAELGTTLYTTGSHHHGYASDDDDADFFVDRDAADIKLRLRALGFSPVVGQSQYEERGEWDTFRRGKIDVWIYNYPVDRVVTVHRVMKKWFGA